MADDEPKPVATLRNPHDYGDRAGKKFLNETGKLHDNAEAHAPLSRKEKHEKDNQQPAGGFDSTPIPSAPPGYTVRITFHRAHNLPSADLNSLSSDPYLIANLRTTQQKRHKQDPDLNFRTPTIRRQTEPEWNSIWKIAHVPHSGFNMKIRLYDEDPADHDDRLGNVHVHVNNVGPGWCGLKEESFTIKKRMASKRAYLFRGCAALLSRGVKMDGSLVISVECLGRSEGDGGRAYTIGPLPWTRHYSPLIGRLTGTKDGGETEDGKKEPEKYNFQAVQMQLAGPVPPALYHRYVEFKPFVASMFMSHSLRGRVLNRALHHQHSRIYNFDRSTLYGFSQEPCVDMTKQFLDFVHYDHDGRIFTYVLTLDARWRFTETGKEFGIDLLSKHTMHSDVSIYIAFSGEFFIRRLKKPWRPKMKPSKTGEGSSNEDDHNDYNDPDSNSLLPEPESDEKGNLKSNRHGADSWTDPSHYQLIIDNDSGTYRPNAKYLPAFRDYMRRSLPGLRVVTLDCQADAEKMGRLKEEQRTRKRHSKGSVQYLQRGSVSSISSISSSDEEDLDKLERRNRGDNQDEKQQGKGIKLRQGARMAATEAKTVVAGAAAGGYAGEGEKKKGDGGEGCAGMGGIVGEDGPVKRKERNERLKAETKDRSRSRNADDTMDGSSAREKGEDAKGGEEEPARTSIRDENMTEEKEKSSPN
jgi:C2 domain